MRLPVGEIVELIGPDRAVGAGFVERLSQPRGVSDKVVGVLVGNCRHLNQFGAQQPQRILFLLALGFGDHNDCGIAKRLSDHSEPNACVTRGAFDNGSAGPQRAALFGVADDVEGGAILDRLGRVHELCLAQDGAAGFLRRPLQFDQRCAANRAHHVIYISHRCHPHIARCATGGNGSIGGMMCGHDNSARRGLQESPFYPLFQRYLP